jgi:hypothetical protein
MLQKAVWVKPMSAPEHVRVVLKLLLPEINMELSHAKALLNSPPYSDERLRRRRLSHEVNDWMFPFAPSAKDLSPTLLSLSLLPQ